MRLTIAFRLRLLAGLSSALFLVAVAVGLYGVRSSAESLRTV